MVMFILSWIDRPEVVVVDAPNKKYALDMVRDGRIDPYRRYGLPTGVQEVDQTSVTVVSPVPTVGSDRPATLRVETFIGIAGASPPPRFAPPNISWYEFQEQAKLVLDRFPTLMDLVPATIRLQWSDGMVSILEVLVEIAERAFPGVHGILTADEQSLNAEHLTEIEGSA